MSDSSRPAAPSLRDVPAYPDITTYGNMYGLLHIWDGDGWKAESLSWKTSSYVASNLSGTPGCRATRITTSAPSHPE
jgi:vanillate/3-O-methylgallate O-demethylase